MFVYCIRNQVNKKKYIGQTIQPILKRWKQHVYESKKGKLSPLSNAIRKYGSENFEVAQIAKITCETNEQGIEWLNILEPLYIKAHNSLIPNGYNLSEGGKNKVTHPDTRIKIGKANKGKKRSDESKKLMGDLKRGKKLPPFTDTHRTNLSLAGMGRQNMLGKKHTIEAKDKMSKSRIGKPSPMKGKKHSPERIARMRAARWPNK